MMFSRSVVDSLCVCVCLTVRIITVQTVLNVVTLPCDRPSNLATLNWTTPSQPQQLYLQWPDGSLTFVATTNTLGKYTCTSQEAGHSEVRAVYTVVTTPLEASSPSHTRSIHTVDMDATSRAADTSAESTTLPIDPATRHSDVELQCPLCRLMNDDNKDERMVAMSGVKCYHTELVAVCVLLVLCACMLLLSLLYIVHQRRSADPLKTLMVPGERTQKQGALETDPVLIEDGLVSEVNVTA